ncbi:unnamed protein product [Zymoseptoria tritici ST99CH_3D1]|nr:unnamed protein product [Zymoseptoria tritici ST99CH_3D1]
MKLAIVAMTALLMAIPALAGKRAYCAGLPDNSYDGYISQKCQENHIPLPSSPPAGTCCIRHPNQIKAMQNVCGSFSVTASVAYGGPC